MKQYIWGPLGMTSTGFRLDQNESIRNHLCATTARTPTGELVASAPYNFQNPVDDLGGGGLHSCPADYIKVLISLLKNDGTLLRPETVKMMFEPQLADPKHLMVMTQDPKGGAMFRGGVDCNTWNFGLGGILTLDDVEGVCKKGTMSWGGLPNLVSYSHPSKAFSLCWRNHRRQSLVAASIDTQLFVGKPRRLHRLVYLQCFVSAGWA